MSEIIEGKPQLSPGVCFICELSNPVKYWDTYRDFYGIVRESLDGRKYVCEECIAQGAKLFGFITPKEAEALKDKLNAAAEEVSTLRSELDAFEAIQKAIDYLNEPVAAAPKPKTARKPAATKA